MRPLLLCCLLVLTACGGGDEESLYVPGVQGAVKSSPAVRAARRAYDGAPPVIPHQSFGVGCTQCHTLRGMSVPEFGFAPPSPHQNTPGMSDGSRCNQCHVFQQTDELFVASGFEGWRPDGQHGTRAYETAPPVIPHPVLMRENCLACHDGPAAREEIRTTHPERANCKQCHVPSTSSMTFRRY